jgi:glycosyltransferase involved in cell wall biosynthesis
MNRSSLRVVRPKSGEAAPKGSHATTADGALSPNRSLQKSFPGVFFVGYIFSGSGYSEETWVEALGLDTAGIYLQVVPLLDKHDSRKLLPRNFRRRLEELARNRVDLSRGIFYVCSPPEQFDRNFSGIYRIGRTMFETDRIPDGWAELCRTMDEIWVPCQFNVETFSGAGVDRSRLRVVHPGVDTGLFRPGAAPLGIPHTRGFNFLSVFDWHHRKGYDVLLRAYLKEFQPDEDVTLILKVYQINDPVSDLQAKLTHFIEREAGMRLEDSPPILLLNGFIAQSSMPRLYASAQAFVLPSRGEGYGRPYMESMACQIPVIATRWSGQMEFLSDENSFPVEIEGLSEVSADVDLENFAGHRWAEPSVDDLRRQMRRVFSDREEAQARAARGRAEMTERFDWSVVIPQWVAEFRRLLD